MTKQVKDVFYLKKSCLIIKCNLIHYVIIKYHSSIATNNHGSTNNEDIDRKKDRVSENNGNCSAKNNTTAMSKKATPVPTIMGSAKKWDGRKMATAVPATTKRQQQQNQ